MRFTSWMLAVILPLLAVPVVAADRSASNGAERVQTGRDIWVQPGDNAGDVTCFGCSIHVRGAVSGDAFALGGRIVVEQGGAINGDVATIAGSIVVENGASIGGDAAAIGGAVRRSPQGVIGGDAASLGMAWLVAIALLPLLALAGLITLIIWLVRRSRQVTPLPAAQA